MVFQQVQKRSPAIQIVDALPALRPIKTSRAYSCTSTLPHQPTPAPKHKQKRTIWCLQLMLLAAMACLVFTRAHSLDPILEPDGAFVGPRKRSLIAASVASGQLRERPSLLTTILDAQQHAQRVETLAEALLVEPQQGEISMFPADSDTSEVHAHPTTGPSGQNLSYYYRFTNVRIGEDGALEFFGGDGSMPPATGTFYVNDATQGAAVQMGAPAAIVLGEDKDKNSTCIHDAAHLLPNNNALYRKLFPGMHRSAFCSRRMIEVRYLSHARPEDSCRQSFDQPTMLIHSRQPRDMWYAWTRGLLPVFQTLRELGFLPVMDVDADGNVREVTEGVTYGACPKVANLTTGAQRSTVDCTQHVGIRGQLRQTCSAEDTWCLPGLWPASMTANTSAPTLLYAVDTALDGPWNSLYTAMSGSTMKAWDDLKGTCLRNLVVGTTRTLSLSEPMPGGGEGGGPVGEQEARAQALEVFSRFFLAVHQRLEMTHAVYFKTYGEWNADRLRRGIKKGHSTLAYINECFKQPAVVQSGGGASETLAEDWQELQSQPPLFGLARVGETLEKEMKSIRRRAAAAVRPSPLGPPADLRREHPRPVVTYISRWHDLERAMLNERQILRYLVWRFDVLVQVTTLKEHIGAAAKLLKTTDVLIGAHGPEWTHALFLKPGAVTLRLLPYGWKRKDGTLLRGNELPNLVHLRRGMHLDWINPHPQYSFFRREDFEQDPDAFKEHPDSRRLGGEWAAPKGQKPHPAWINANTYADLNHLGPYIDEVMRLAGIPKMNPPQYVLKHEVPGGLQENAAEKRRGEHEGEAMDGEEEEQLEEDSFEADVEQESDVDNVTAIDYDGNMGKDNDEYDDDAR